MGVARPPYSRFQRCAAVVEHADEEEQRAGGNAVGEHLKTAPCMEMFWKAKMPSTTKPRC